MYVLTYQSLHEVEGLSVCRPLCQGEGSQGEGDQGEGGQGEESEGTGKQQQLMVEVEDAIHMNRTGSVWAA